MAKAKIDVYQKITDRIIERMEAGEIPWSKPWHGVNGMPRNYRGNYYRGVNVLLLAMQGRKSATWATYKQVQEAGGQVRKGEEGTPVVFWKLFKTKDKKTNEEKTVPMIRYYTVFNFDQIDNLEDPWVLPEEGPGFDPIEAAQKIVEGYAGMPEITRSGSAWYRPSNDTIGMPDPDTFTSPESYYATLYHEMGHSTGHRKRLNREGLTNPAKFGSHKYAKEELVAEFTSAFLMSMSGITCEHTERNNVAYLQSWMRKLKQDPKLLIQGAGEAQKAADKILGIKFEAND